MFPAIRRVCAALSFVAIPLAPASADTIPSIVVTPYYVATSIARAGSTVSVISRDEIARSSAGTVAELLRTSPGIAVTENGGPGGQALVSIRGAETQHTLVLIDGIRVNDSASARDEFDFATFSTTDVERIEILRGPQSALYGSDAIGGVINIITRRAAAGLHGSATVEGGSYGTKRTTLTASGMSGRWSLAASGTYFGSNGFSRVGNRDGGEPDATLKYAGTLRGAYDAGEGRKIEFGLDGYHQASDLDKSATVDAAGYTSVRDLVSGFARASFPGLDDSLDNTLTLFATQTKRFFGEPTRDTWYRADNVGGEYQGNFKLGSAGSLLVGGRLEQESAYQRMSTQPAPTYDRSRLLYAGYLLYQLPATERLNLSFAGRYDGEADGENFVTGRVTAAYEIPDMEARLRASLGTGVKRPTAFQLSYNPALLPERSIGADLGFEKALFDGRLSGSVTGFWNRFGNLINFDGDVLTGTYKNIDQAETAGIEVAASAQLVPNVLTGNAAYTWLVSRDLSNGLPLQRRPEHSGKVSVSYIGIPNLTATLSATLVGLRYNDDMAKVLLPGYARFDFSASYRASDSLTLFARIENLFNASYQETTGYNTAGLSAYAGLTWRR